MKLFKNNEGKKTEKLPMSGKVRKGFRFYCTAVMALTFVVGTSVTAFAANDPIAVVNNLSDFIFGLVRAVGMIMLGFGIVQIGLSLKSHDPSKRANGFLTLAGGVVITFAKEILTLMSMCSLPLTATTPTIGSPSVGLKLILSFSVTVSSFPLRSSLPTTPEPRA